MRLYPVAVTTMRGTRKPATKTFLTSLATLLAAVLIPASAATSAAGAPAEPSSGGASATGARASASGYLASAHFAAPKPARIGSRCIYPKFQWMVATNAPAGAEFHGSVRVTMDRREYGSLPYPRLNVNQWNGVQITRPVCKAGRYHVALRGIVTPRAYGVATNEIYAHVSGGATYVIR